MEQETITPGRGSLESAAWFRDQLESLGMGQSALGRLMIELGDDRQLGTILRSLGRMASGDARVSGEMRAMLGLMRRHTNVVEAQGIDGSVQRFDTRTGLPRD